MDRENLEVRLEREFDAPREVIFKAMTEPESIPKWWGPRGVTTIVEKMELKVGGQWRFVHTDAQGTKFVFFGEYREIAAPEKIVDTFEFEPFAGHVIVETVTLEDLGGRTKVRTVSKYPSIQDLDGMVKSGMETGAVESWERLAELVEKK